MDEFERKGEGGTGRGERGGRERREAAYVRAEEKDIEES